MWAVYLELFGIPLAILIWLLYRLFIKKQTWMKVKPDFQVAVFVCLVWIVVYFILLR
jgi:hypothetical protein